MRKLYSREHWKEKAFFYKYNLRIDRYLRNM